MTRTTLEQAVYRDFGYADSPATAILNRVRGYLNDRHRRLLVRPGLEKLRMQTGTLTLVASTPIYGLDLPIQKLLKVVDTTNDQALEQRTLDWYRRVDPDPQSGTQEYWIPMRWGPALRDIGGTGLWVVSTSASDTTQAVNVETINTAGSHTQTTATLNGTTRVQIGTATTHQRLLRFAHDAAAAAVGVIELYDASSAGNRVSAIHVGRTNAQLLTIALWPTPAAADTLRLDYLHHIRDFSVAYDEPQLPLDFHYLVSVGAKIDEARHKDDARWRQWQDEWEEGIVQLEGFVNNFTDTLIIPGMGERTGRSNLGPNYPNGIW